MVSVAERVEAYRARKRRAGFQLLSVWVPVATYKGVEKAAQVRRVSIETVVRDLLAAPPVLTRSMVQHVASALGLELTDRQTERDFAKDTKPRSRTPGYSRPSQGRDR